MLHVILYEPEIPPNTGNIIRLCANTGAQLHLIAPLGFEVSDTRLRRAGLDYHELANITVHQNWHQCRSTIALNRLYAFTTRANRVFTEPRYQAGDGLLFGPESRGLPQSMLDELGDRYCLKLPMRAGSRSLNLSNCTAVAVYEAWRQMNFRM